MFGTKRGFCALPTQERGYDKYWRRIIGSRSLGRMFWLRVEGKNAARFLLYYFAIIIALGETLTRVSEVIIRVQPKASLVSFLPELCCLRVAKRRA